MSRGAPDVFDVVETDALLGGGDAFVLTFMSGKFGECADELWLKLRHARDAKHQCRIAVDGNWVRREAQMPF